MRERAIRIVTLVAILAVGGGCSAPIPAGTKLPQSEPSPTAAMAGRDQGAVFEALPYRLVLPAGWVGAPTVDPEASVDAVARTDPDIAAALQAVLDASSGSPVDFVAVLGSDRRVNLTGVRGDTGGLSPAAVLELAETQNVDGIARLPGIVVAPIADRVNLPVGEAVRVRWQTHDAFGAGSGDIGSIGYAFVSGPTLYTFVFSAPPDRIGELEPTFEAILGSFEVTASAAPSAEPESCIGDPSVLQHGAPELESRLPSRVAGRALSTWSVRGRCWIEMMSGRPATELEAAWRDGAGGSAPPLDLDRIEYAVAGRVDTDNDPPYFVLVIRFPPGGPEAELATALFFQAAGISSPPSADDDSWETVPVAGRMVRRGTKSVITQSDHQQGPPYLFDDDGALFLVITDQPAWAEEAIALVVG